MTRAEKTAYWRAHVAGLRQSGLSIRAYAQRAGVSVSGLQYWRKRAVDAGPGRAAPLSDTPAFLPVTLRPAASAPDVAHVEIVLISGRRLRLTGPVEAPWLSTLVQILEAPCC